MRSLNKYEMGSQTLSIQACFPVNNSLQNSSDYYSGSLGPCATIEDAYNNAALHHRTGAITTVSHFEGIKEFKVDIIPAAAAAEPPNASNNVPHESAHQLPRTTPTNNLTMYVPLCRAAFTGDWEKAKAFIALHPTALTARITKGWETALHIAAGAKHVEFVEELVRMMDAKDLALKNKCGNTALCFAAASGITRIAETMVKKNENLPTIRGSKGVTPLHMAALLGHRDMVWFLYSVTRNVYLSVEDLTGLLIATISSDLYDVALHIVQWKPELATQRDANEETALHVLARKPSAFSDTIGLRVYQRCIYPLSLFLAQTTGIKEIRQRKLLRLEAQKLVKYLWSEVLFLDDAQIGDLLRSPSRPLFVAAEFGNFEFIVELLRSYPVLLWKVDEKTRSIFHIAVMHRQEKIFRLIYQIGAHKDIITSYKDETNTNILHLAAKLAPFNRLNIVSGAALQMQRELLWFKEVEKNVQPSYKEMIDDEGQTPQMLFTKEHKRLVKEGEKWMKDTATSCMLVAALITTVMFAAIFTVPGGNDNDSGIPIFLKDKSFILFAISDALALFSSVTSILMFLSILTSRYAEEDFLESLPKRLITGLATLFFSIASMLIAFSASFFIVLGHQRAWIVIPILGLTACIPITLFAFLQFPLLADMIHSTYGSGLFSRNYNDTLF